MLLFSFNTLWAILPELIEINLDEIINYHENKYLCLSKEFRDLILRHEEILPDYEFSIRFNEVHDSIKSGAKFILKEIAQTLVEEYSLALELHELAETLKPIKIQVEEYKRAIELGQADITIVSEFDKSFVKNNLIFPISSKNS